jgi:hypothetical protein
MPIHHNGRCSNTFFMHAMEVRCNLKVYMATTIAY